MKRKFFLSGGIALLVVVAFFSIRALISKSDADRKYNGLFHRHTKIFAPPVPSAASFAGEPVPLDKYYVREALEREILAATFMHTSTILMFKRANRWFPVIEPILKQQGIPDDFKYLALAESNLANVVSPAGAEGYWQFLKPTGQKYGLEINDNVDERYHMIKATVAACNYFSEAYGKFGNWTLAAASYNRGLDGLSRALENQAVSNFYDLYLNDETSRYIYRIVAMKEIYNHPVRYGFYLRQQDFYPQVPTRSVTVDSSISNLPQFAKQMNSNFRILRELNPWIQNYTLPNKSRKTYTLLFPLDNSVSQKALMEKVPVSEIFYHDTLKISEVN
jgi:hypothetical protein